MSSSTTSLKLKRYQTGVWDTDDGGRSWSFACVYLGDSLAAARRALKDLWCQLPPDTAKWAVYILDQRTMEIVYE